MPTHNKELKVGNFPIARLCFSFLRKSFFARRRNAALNLLLFFQHFWMKFVSTLRLGLAGAGLYNNNQFSISASLVLRQSPVILPHGRFELSESIRPASLIKVGLSALYCWSLKWESSRKVFEFVGKTVCSVVFETHLAVCSSGQQTCDAPSESR